MRSFPSIFGPSSRLLARHLGRLAVTLETFGTRLREAVAGAVGETVANAVREAALALLDDRPAASPAPARPSYSPGRTRSPWDTPDPAPDDPWFPEPDRDRWEDDALDDDVPPAEPTPPTAGPSRWLAALAAGVQATLAWLRHRVGRFPVLVALALGLLTALVTFAGGPLAAAGAAVLGAALRLAMLSDSLQAGTRSLGGLGPA